MITRRKAELSDLRELQNIGVESYLPHYTHMWKAGGVEWYLNKCFGDEFLECELSDPNVEYYIIASEDEDIGILKLVLQKPLPDSDIENALYLEKVYFIKEWTGKGVGREMIDFSIERAKALNCECIWLVAMDTADKPVKAYERAGFTIHTHKMLDFELLKEEYRGTFVMKNCFETNEKI